MHIEQKNYIENFQRIDNKLAILIKELAGILYNLNTLYYKEKKKEEKEKLKIYFDNLSKLLEESVRSKFDENNKLYIDTVRKLKKTAKQIEILKKDLEKINILFKNLSEILMQVDTLLFDYKKELI